MAEDIKENPEARLIDRARKFGVRPSAIVIVHFPLQKSQQNLGHSDRAVPRGSDLALLCPLIKCQQEMEVEKDLVSPTLRGDNLYNLDMTVDLESLVTQQEYQHN